MVMYILLCALALQNVELKRSCWLLQHALGRMVMVVGTQRYGELSWGGGEEREQKWEFKLDFSDLDWESKQYFPGKF